MHFVDAHWQDVRRGLPVRFHEIAQELPFRLGLSARADGLWTDFTRLEPMCDLPAFAADPLDETISIPLSDARLRLFQEAHCAAGYFGLLVDRLADGQCRLHPDLPRLRPRLRAHWIAALSRATGDAERARYLVRRSVLDWEAALRHEVEHRLPRRWTAKEYAQCIRGKTSWLAVTSVGLLESTGQSSRVAGFLEVFDAMLLSLQTLDDGLDAEEDRALRGVSYPDALGVSPGALIKVSSLLCVRAAETASRHRFEKLSSWLERHARSIAQTPAPGNPVLTGFEAMIFLDSLSDAG